MSQRGTPIAKGYVDDIGGLLLFLIVIVLVLSMAIDGCHHSKIRDLQRRVGQLEQGR